MEKVYAIVGLGNPGKAYEKNRHNVGVHFLHTLISMYRLPPLTKKGDLFLSGGIIEGKKCFLLFPQTYMNRSGAAVGQFVRLHKIPLSQCIVCHDDLDLALGKMRVKVAGGSGGHNGLKSLDSSISPNYTRLRIGIDRPPLKEMVSSYVLSDFMKDEKKVLDVALHAAASYLSLIFNDESPLFMTRVAEACQK